MASPPKISSADLKTARQLKFYFLKVPEHNGNHSNAFNKAQCVLKVVREEKVKYFHLDNLFKRGFELLDGNCSMIGEGFLKATQILQTYLDDIENQKQCLLKVLNDRKSTETEITIALAEHLLLKLAPGQACILDNRMANKDGCKCGCQKKLSFGSTGIGNENVWHGFMDIIFSSYDGDIAGVAQTRLSSANEASIATEGSVETEPCSDDETIIVDDTDEATPSKRQKVEENEKDSPGGKSVVEVKLDSKYYSEDTEDQAISQTIVFGHLQRNRHPEFSNLLVPNILISSHFFRISMYDAKNDFLVQSYDFRLQKHFVPSVVILWMVLHWRIFCNGIEVESLQQKINIDSVQSEFQNQISEKSKRVYNSELKSCVSSFPLVKRHCLPDVDDLLFGDPLEF